MGQRDIIYDIINKNGVSVGGVVTSDTSYFDSEVGDVFGVQFINIEVEFSSCEIHLVVVAIMHIIDLVFGDAGVVGLGVGDGGLEGAFVDS